MTELHDKLAVCKLGCDKDNESDDDDDDENILRNGNEFQIPNNTSNVTINITANMEPPQLERRELTPRTIPQPPQIIVRSPIAKCEICAQSIFDHKDTYKYDFYLKGRNLSKCICEKCHVTQNKLSNNRCTSCSHLSRNSPLENRNFNIGGKQNELSSTLEVNSDDSLHLQYPNTEETDCLSDRPTSPIDYTYHENLDNLYKTCLLTNIAETENSARKSEPVYGLDGRHYPGIRIRDEFKFDTRKLESETMDKMRINDKNVSVHPPSQNECQINFLRKQRDINSKPKLESRTMDKMRINDKNLFVYPPTKQSLSLTNNDLKGSTSNGSTLNPKEDLNECQTNFIRKQRDINSKPKLESTTMDKMRINDKNLFVYTCPECKNFTGKQKDTNSKPKLESRTIDKNRINNNNLAIYTCLKCDKEFIEEDPKDKENSFQMNCLTRKKSNPKHDLYFDYLEEDIHGNDDSDYDVTNPFERETENLFPTGTHLPLNEQYQSYIKVNNQVKGIKQQSAVENPKFSHEMRKLFESQRPYWDSKLKTVIFKCERGTEHDKCIPYNHRQFVNGYYSIPASPWFNSNIN